MITIPNKPLFAATIVGTILTLGVFVGSVKINGRS
jgi:hypothetical protein